MALFSIVLLNIPYIVSVFYFLSAFLGESKKDKNEVFFNYFILYVWLLSVYYIGGTPLKNLAINIFGLSMLTSLYNGSYIRKFFSVIITIIFFIITDLIISFIFSNEINILEMKDPKIFVKLLIVRILAFFISFIFFTYTKKRNSIILSRYYFFIILTTILSSFIIYFLSLYINTFNNIFINIIVLFFVNIIFFFIYNDIVDLFEKEHNNAQIKNQYELIKMQSDNINESTMELRKLEHDLKNKLTPIAYLVKEEKLNELSEHFDSILGEFSKISVFKESGILELDGILNSKYNKGKNLGIEFDSYISISDKINVNGMDLAVIMGNLLDNAIEGTSKVSDKWIKFSIKEIHGVLFISVENSYDGIVNIKNNEFLTRKEDKKHHGMGLRNIRTIIEKYDGDLDIKHNYSTFKAIIVLYEIY